MKEEMPSEETKPKDDEQSEEPVDNTIKNEASGSADKADAQDDSDIDLDMISDGDLEDDA